MLDSGLNYFRIKLQERQTPVNFMSESSSWHVNDLLSYIVIDIVVLET